MNKALFLDRDGVINVEKNYVYKIKDIEFIHGVFEILRDFQKLGYLLIIITNQSGIGRGYYNEKDFHILNDWMIEQFKTNGVRISKVYYSPYHPEHGVDKYKKNTNCRKPNPGLFLRAQKEFNIEMLKSISVGDKESDIAAAINAGVKTNILVKSGHAVDLENTQADIILESIKDLNSLDINNL